MKCFTVVCLSRAGAPGRPCVLSHTVGWACPWSIWMNWFSELSYPWHVSVIVLLPNRMACLLRMGGWDSRDTPWGYLHNLLLPGPARLSAPRAETCWSQTLQLKIWHTYTTETRIKGLMWYSVYPESCWINSSSKKRYNSISNYSPPFFSCWLTVVAVALWI